MTQTALAGELGISPSYLKLIEHNQRPVTVPLLIYKARLVRPDRTRRAPVRTETDNS